MARKNVGAAPTAATEATTKAYVDSMVGVRDYWDAGDQGLLGWTVPAELCSSQVLITAGSAQLTRVKIAKDGTIGNIYYGVQTAGASLTSCAIQIYNTSGVLVATTGSLTAVVTATGEKISALTVPLAVQRDQEYWVVIYALGTTGPTIRATLTVNGINYALTTSSPLRTARKTGLAAAPTAIVKTEYTAFANQIPLFALGA